VATTTTAIATTTATAIAAKTAAKVTTAATACAAAGAAIRTDTAAFLWRPMPKPRDDKQRANY
jgi:hypothetical protein